MRNQNLGPSDVAIIGMASVFPGAGDVSRFWSNTLRGIDAITEVPADRWDWRLYYDPDPKAPDKIVSKWGGFVPDVAFDPLRYGMPPSSLPSIEPVQLLALEVVRGALSDAGYEARPFDRERTSVVLGMGGGAAQVAMGYAFRSYLPMLDTVIPGGGRAAMEACRGQLPEWTEDSFPGFLLNVTAGRIANRLDLGGSNYTVDAACGSSLAAASLAVRELEVGAADMVILGGVDTVQNPFTYLAFSKTQAFSPRGRCRPFDASADGIVISEGVAALVLKRREDAERDGDRIYAVIKGLGSSSDGRARGLTAPVVEGQVRAIERAYDKAGVSPSTVGYVEAHGTGTALGDVVEFESLSRVFRSAGVGTRDCVVGSVKSMIGHAKCAAGLAGLINAARALYYKVLPPTIGIETPNPKLDLDQSPFRLCTQAQPWLHADEDRPRRAGVSAFGFGGTNFHAVLEEYDRHPAESIGSALPEWPAELFVFGGERPADLFASIDRLAVALRGGARPSLRDLSHTMITAREGKGPAVLAIVADSHDDLLEKLRIAREAVAAGVPELDDPRGIAYAASPSWSGARLAFLFPGQGTQSPGMLRELALAFSEVRDAFEQFDRDVRAEAGEPPGPFIFPPPAFDESARVEARRALARTEIAQPAIGAACVGMFRLLRSLGLEPDVVAGHSYGELVALHAAGALDARDLAGLSAARGRLMVEAGDGATGAMAAVLDGPEAVDRLVDAVPGVRVANFNGPRQTVVAGPTESIDRLMARAAEAGIGVRRLPVSSAFHTPMVAGAREPFAELVRERLRRAPDRPVYSNIDAAPHPSEPGTIATRLGEHLAGPVQFAGMMEAMYADGASVFIEVGPGSVLTPMVSSILGDRPHLAVSADAPTSTGLAGFLRQLARMLAAGLPIRLERLTAGRDARRLDLDDLPPGELASPPSASTWLVNGSRARPFAAPEPARLGTGPALSIPVAAPVTTTTATKYHVNGNGPIHTNGKPRSPMTTKPPTFPDATTSMTPTTATTPPRPPADPVLESFQETMRTFLEVQKATMLAYLNARNAGTDRAHDPGPSNGAVPASPLTKRTQFGPGVEEAPVAPRTNRTQFEPAELTPVAPLTKRTQFEAVPEPFDPRQNGEPLESHRASRSKDTSGNGRAGSVELADAEATGRAAITERLLEIVRDRTGYPIETLGLDLDIEADLGIDSIKRVEILSKLREAFPGRELAPESSDQTEALARARTLGAIVDRMAAMVASEDQAAGMGEDPGPSMPDPIPQAPPVERRVLEVVDAPVPDGLVGLMPGGRVVVTDDGRGVADELSMRLEAGGIAVDRLGSPGNPVDWTSPSAISEAVDPVRARGPIAGIVHALPLGHRDAEDWPDRIGATVKGLFLLARQTAPDLEAAASTGGACLVAATAMGGRSGSGGEPPISFFPGGGGVAGLVKTLAREWPGVRCRVVDLDPGDTSAGLAARLVDEVFAVDGRAEVGYDRGRRVRLRTIASPLARGNPAIELASGEPIIVTGGARGITALVAAELARAWRPTLLIVGTTPEPDGPEPADTSGLSGEAELKAALLARLRREGHPHGPSEIEAAYQALRRAREVRDNLEMLRREGARVEYARVDVRDPDALAAALEGWHARHGDPVGLVHGAGLIKDKLIREKTPESFDRVLGTKVDGALNLVRLLNPEILRFTALFSSIAGRFGNVGQSDYAAANDLLSKLALWLDRRWPGRVVSLIWGPWSGIGMVSQLEEHLGRRGLGMIAPEAGRSLLLDELRFGRKGDVEVIYTGGLGTLEDPLPIGTPAETSR